MIFTTHWFLFFAALVVVIFWVLPWPQARLWWLGIGCAVFHTYFAGPAGVAPILVLMVVTYFAGRSRRRRWCTAGIVICVAALCFYKYTAFLSGAIVSPISAAWAESIARAAGEFGPAAPPLAVSFFTFEFVHYLYDVRRGGEPIRNPLKFALFALFFPSLVAGPIKRYTQFLPSLETAVARRPLASDFAEGAVRMAIGFFKKVVLADNLTFFINLHQPQFEALDGIARWSIFVAIAFRILLDFSGYSDIAIGCARLLGVRLPENFNWPYLARSLQEFWQRWHISLSSWIRDYVYIPLGGNRHGHARRLVNGLLAFGICGLWHGPAWHFVVWGLYHGIGLGINASYQKVPLVGSGVAKMFAKEPALGWALTQAYVWFGWLLFFYPLADALTMARQLF